MKARNAKSLSARCAGACPFGCVSARARSAAGGECGRDRDFPLKREKKNTKQDSNREKVHLFLQLVLFRRGKAIFFCLKLRLFEIYPLPLRLIKHNLPFIPATRWRPYSANPWAFSPC